MHHKAIETRLTRGCMDKKEAAKKVYEARQRLEAIGMVKTYGKTPEERIELITASQMARLDLISAEHQLQIIEKSNPFDFDEEWDSKKHGTGPLTGDY